MARSGFVHRAAGEQPQPHVAVEHLIPCAVHNTHAAFANLCKDSVMIERLSDHW
jgi:hypothetical protein